ncbi:SusC/RagA family TonB-linked outer membrane protein [Pedobacter sp. MC2016-24]|uniref:SusC/RagA family TonB-linked outer membrane protein n=1 Tax=Pedobacter sp. MC2016-24 TaxID=2780090 RepID=UPI00187EE9D0|nr:SusC/RagA family TonB-linked outer membrane protein [Pedobacter sp. MC2016-24]MBE9602952.1 SusC/RagA family TonB-linked outer membrane protein [Pedobacter sp. MC2016-24]
MKKLLQSLLILMFIAGSAIAQERTITGTVTGKDDGLPIPGVSVKIVGTQNGTSTDGSGKFALKADASAASLEVSSIGYVKQTVTIGSSNVINVVLATDAQQLGEVVVTALGVSKDKRTLGYSAQAVKAEDILNSRESNVVNALAGKVAGVQINNSGGQAGSSSRITIRGTTSLIGDNQPLFIIDGIPMDNSTNRGITENDESTLFSGNGGNRGIDLDPNTIETMTVLKGAAASALYGSRGAMGVIMITTKRGKKDANRKYPRVSFSSSLALDNAYTKGYQNSYLLGTNGLYKNGLPPGLGGYAEDGGATQISQSWGPHKDSVSQAVINAVGMPVIRDPRKDFYRTGKVWNNSVSISGGGDISTYILTYSNLDQQGIVDNNTFKRNSVSGNFTSQLGKDFKSSTSVSYTNSQNQRMPEGNSKRSYLYSLNFAPISFDAKGQYEQFGNRSWTNENGFNNPYWLINNIAMPSTVDRFIVSNESTLDILSWLKLTNRVGLDTYTDQQAEHVNFGTISVPRGRMYDALIKQTQINNDLILSANYKINDDMNISGLIGNNINQRKYARRTVRGSDIIPGYYDINGASTTEALQQDEKRRIIGVYGSATFEYKSFLYLNATARNDWSSTLPVDNNSFFYPSVSAGFVFTDVIGLKENPYFSYGKLRLSLAQSGNDADPYSIYQTYLRANPNDGQRGNIVFPFNGVNAFEKNARLFNEGLKPEKVTEKEIGLELKFFRNRLGIDAAYYDKVSKNQILPQEVSGASGYVDRVINAGKIRNKGFELTVNASPFRTEDFSWDIQLNFAQNRYKLESIAEGVDNIFLAGFESPQIRADKDYGYGVIWGTRYARNSGGQLLIDDDGYPIVADDLGPIGNVTPKWTGGFRNTFSYKGFSLSTLFDVRHGGDILNFDLYYSTFYGTAKVTEQRNTMKLWQGIRESDGAPNTTKILQDQEYFQSIYTLADENLVEKGGFLKLREVTLSYNLPQKLIAKTPFESIGFSVTGRNLWIKSDFSYGDPEGSLLGNGNAQGFYHAVTPGTKGVTFGLNVKF